MGRSPLEARFADDWPVIPRELSAAQPRARR
jgi:hypothetical protein